MLFQLYSLQAQKLMKLLFLSSVLQYVTYYSHAPLRVQKVECVPVVSKETGAVHKKSERSFAHELLMPETVQPTDDEYSGVITISYELRVEAVLRGFFKNLVLNLPFKVYSQDASTRLGSVRPSLPPRPDDGPPGPDADTVAVAVPGNPFESAVTLPVYPPLDSSIGSPSHSSQYSECSSLNSTASDSTLSPAVGGVELSYTSDSQSSQFGSPSTRVSLRSSTNVPYMPYSSSPLMVQSYPPPHLPPYPLTESPQYALLALTPPPAIAANTASVPSQPQASGYNQLPSTSAASSSLLQRHALRKFKLNMPTLCFCYLSFAFFFQHHPMRSSLATQMHRQSRRSEQAIGLPVPHSSCSSCRPVISKFC